MTKKESVKKETNGTFGIVGFTLSIAGLYSLLMAGMFAIPIFITGLVFCWIQQRKKSTKLGKAGLIINIVGIIVSIVFAWILIKYILTIGEQIKSGAIQIPTA